MPVICLGPVCIPMSAFVPFCIGVLHRYGYMKWVQEEWFTFTWLKPRVKKLPPILSPHQCAILLFWKRKKEIFYLF